MISRVALYHHASNLMNSSGEALVLTGPNEHGVLPAFHSLVNHEMKTLQEKKLAHKSDSVVKVLHLKMRILYFLFIFLLFELVPRELIC